MLRDIPLKRKARQARTAFVNATAATSLVLSALALSAHATPVVAGRAKTELPNDQRWEVEALASPDIRINEGNFTMPSQTQVLRLVSGSNRTDAILIVTGNVGGQIGNVSWGSSCPKEATSTGLFVLNRSTEYKDNCLLVLGPVKIDSVLKQVSPELAKTMREKEALFGGGGYFVRASYASGSTRLGIDAFLRQDFAGSKTSLPTGESTGGIPAEIVQWGNTLVDELKGSVHSITGRFQIPRLEFNGQ